MRSLISFSIYVNTPTTLEATPKQVQVVNSFDYNAGLVGLERVEGETNVELRERIWDASVHPSGPLYEGVVNGVSRDLGFLRQHAITIDLKLNSAGEPVATSPRVDILANRVILYSDWRPTGTKVIDKEIYFYQNDSEGYYLNNLVDSINASNCFSAILISDVRPNTHTTSLIKKTSHLFVPSEAIQVDKRTTLRFKYISKDGIMFEDKDTFSTETAAEPSDNGEFLINYTEGKVTSYNLPNEGNGCSYHANIFPLEIDYLPVQVFSLNDEDFTSELFNKDTLDSGEEINSLLNHEGSQIYHQLYKAAKVFWGK